ncbi:MAG: hypothetical protein ACTSRA_13715 [Promethearchaeota archaeon]
MEFINGGDAFKIIEIGMIAVSSLFKLKIHKIQERSLDLDIDENY